MLDICLLGCGGMLPLPERFLTSLLVRHQGSNILIDCGEGTQVALYMSPFSLKNIDYILITHFHGDHVAGLPGLLMTIGNNMRAEPLHIYGGVGLKAVMTGLLVICPQLPFEVVIHEISFNEQTAFSLGGLTVQSLPVEHRVPCLAYSLQLPRQGKFDVAKAKALGVPTNQWGILQSGQSVCHQGRIIAPEEVLGASRKGLKVTYATDCRPNSALEILAQESDLLVAEGLYGDDDKKHSAAEKGHMVFSEAATVAKNAHVNQLWLTHYSPAMRDCNEFLSQTQQIFANTYCGENLLMTTLKFPKD